LRIIPPSDDPLMENRVIQEKIRLSAAMLSFEYLPPKVKLKDNYLEIKGYDEVFWKLFSCSNCK